MRTTSAAQHAGGEDVSSEAVELLRAAAQETGNSQGGAPQQTGEDEPAPEAQSIDFWP